MVEYNHLAKRIKITISPQKKKKLNNNIRIEMCYNIIHI